MAGQTAVRGGLGRGCDMALGCGRGRAVPAVGAKNRCQDDSISVGGWRVRAGK